MQNIIILPSHVIKNPIKKSYYKKCLLATHLSAIRVQTP